MDDKKKIAGEKNAEGSTSAIHSSSTSTMADAEDQKPRIEEECRKHCPVKQKLYDDCVKRVREKGDGNCVGYYLELWHCIDHCAAPQYFKLLK